MPKTNKSKKEKPKVKIFMTPTCVYCNHAKEFFKENNVKFKSVDVSKNKNAIKEMIEISGQRAVPVIIIENHDPIIGFDQEAIEEALNLK